MKNKDVAVLAIDAGGTYFKSGIIDADGCEITGDVAKIPIDSDGSKENIISVYCEIIVRAFDYSRKANKILIGMGVSTPGPFDYSGYKSLMTHKFKNIYGVNIRDELYKQGVIPEGFGVKFMHDAHAFLLGEHWVGAAKGFARAAAVIIGTGLGFGCMLDGRIMENSSGGPFISIYKRPYEEGILEDYVSGRGVVKIYRKLAKIGESVSIDAKEIGLLADSGKDANAIKAYEEMGRILAENLHDILNEFSIECLIFGGQISKSFAIMEGELRKGLEGIVALKKISKGYYIDSSPLVGVARSVFETT